MSTNKGLGDGPWGCVKVYGVLGVISFIFMAIFGEIQGENLFVCALIVLLFTVCAVNWGRDWFDNRRDD